MSDQAQPASGSERVLLLLMFLCSGILIIQYEVLWVRLITFVVGSGVKAVAAVTSAYLLGLAIGAAWFGRLSDRRALPLRLYGVLEVLVGVAHLAAFAAFGELDALGRWLHASAISYPLARALAIALAFLMVVLPAVFIGGLLPSLLRQLIRSDDDVSSSPAMAYAVHTLGGVAGALVLVGWMLPTLGYRGAFLAASAGNVLIGLLAVGLAGSLSRPPAPASPTSPSDEPAAVGDDAAARRSARLVLAAYGAAGFAALGYQVIWSRLLDFIFRGQLQTFGYILAIVLSGLVVGNLVGAKLITRDARTMFGLLLWGGGVLGAATVPLVAATGINPLLLLLVLAVCTLSGACFPIAVALAHRELAVVGRTLGNVYAVNTAGCIVGALVTGFVIVPAIGSQLALLLLAGLQLGCGTLLLRGGRLPAAIGAVAVLAGIGLTTPAHGIWQRQLTDDEQRVIYTSESAFGVINVVEHHGTRAGGRTLYGGAYISGSSRRRRRVQVLQGQLAMLMHANPQRVCEIGYGTGEILSNIQTHAPERIDLVEIDDQMVPVADRFFERLTGRPSQQPNVRVLVRDGRYHLSLPGERYDVIMSDSFFLYAAAATRLYTVEHFRNGRARLREGGIMLVWLPLNLPAERFSIATRSLLEVFPNVLAWSDGATAFLIASEQPLKLDLADIQRRFEASAASRAKLFAVDDALALLACFRQSGEALRAAVGEGPLHHDLQPTFDFANKKPDKERDRAHPLYRALEAGTPDCLLPLVAPADRPALRELAAAVREATADHHAAIEVVNANKREEDRKPSIREGIKLIERAVARHPRFAEARRDLCSAYRMLAERVEDPAEQLALLERGQQAHAWAMASLLMLRQLYEDAGRAADVARIQAMVTELDPYALEALEK